MAGYSGSQRPRQAILGQLPRINRADGSPIRVLLVDDEPALTNLVKMALHYEGWVVDIAHNGREAMAKFERISPDVLVLDIMLPDVDGLQILERVRQSDAYTPTLFLTARDSVMDRVTGLTAGADDYMTKPFSPREMVTRVRAILRRAKQAATPATVPADGTLDFGELRLDVPRREVRVSGRLVTLTAKEFDLLRTLAGSPGTVFSRDALLNQVWGYDYYGDARTVDVHVGTLRKKIESQPSTPRWIKTVWGIGYKFDDSVLAVSGTEGE